MSNKLKYKLQDTINFMLGDFFHWVSVITNTTIRILLVAIILMMLNKMDIYTSIPSSVYIMLYLWMTSLILDNIFSGIFLEIYRLIMMVVDLLMRTIFVGIIYFMLNPVLLKISPIILIGIHGVTMIYILLPIIKGFKNIYYLR